MIEFAVAGFAVGCIFAGFAGYKSGGFVERWKIEKEHIILSAKLEAYEKMLDVSKIKREIR